MGNATHNRSNESRIRSLPCWAGAVDIAPLKGGLSNESFLVTDPAGKHVVRFGRDYPFHHVSRERDLIAARAAHAAGIAPQVEYAQPGVMVSSYLGARTYDASDVRRERVRIAHLVREFHVRLPKHVVGPGFMFWVFHVIRDYARTLIAGRSRLSTECPYYLALADEMEEAQQPLPIIFGHNDLLPANFLDDGDRLWLIDFEYAGFGTGMFDLAGIASNADMNDDEAHELLTAYFGAKPSSEILRAHAAMQCASLLREAMWSLVSELHLNTPGVDYVAYTEENLTRLRAALETYRRKFGKSSS